MIQDSSTELILASASTGRAMILKGAGLKYSIEPADIDEAAIREALYTGDNKPDPKDVAEILARAKAQKVSESRPGALVIGADQVLALGDEIFDKPGDMAKARDNLLKFRGRTHYLHAALAVARNGETLWATVETAALTMRDFSPEFLGRYLAEAGDQVLTTVGAYRLESFGIHLFEKIQGDYFTILGLPILSLLAFLREQKIIME